MIEKTLYFNFAYQLDEEFLVDIEFVDPFNGTDETGFLVSGDEDFTELACA